MQTVGSMLFISIKLLNRGYSDVGSKGELLFSEEVDCEGGCAVSAKNEYLLEGALTVEAVWCDLDSFFGGKCEWKNLY